MASTSVDVLLDRLRRAPPVLVDSLLGVVLAGLTWGTILLDRDCPCSPMPAWAFPAVLGQTLPLAFRRRAPVPVWAVVGVMTAVYGVADLHDPPIFFGAVVAIYTVASRTSRRTSYVAGAITAVAALAAMAAPGDTALIEIAFNYAVLGTAWILGDSVRVHRAYTVELERRAAALERERQDEARRAAAAERVRIARELHDVVAHHVSVIALQSQAAEVLLPADPERAAEAVGEIGVTARNALTELRRLLGALRQDDDEVAARAPQPHVADLEPLVQSVRDAGLTVSCTVEGEPRPLPPGVDLSAYRIVQEALTNVLKHARATRADVVVRYGAEHLLIRVVDDGTGGSGGNGQGHGLIGMRERVALFGGELSTGPRPGGGFTVEARLPLPAP